MALSTVNGESVVTNISPTGPGGSCSGACTEVAQYVWSSGTGLLNVTGREDPLGNYTSATYNSNGLPTQIAYGDSDADPTNGGYQRTTYLYYDSTYPGRIAEIRRESDLDSSRTSCSATSTTGCARTIYTYGSDTTLEYFQQTGTTLNSSGSNTTFTNTTTYTHDTSGRLSEVDGPVSGMKTTYDYYSSTDPTLNGFLEDYKVYKDGTNHLDTNIIAYDFWGNVTGREDPDTTVSCRTFDSSRNYLTQTREAMAGQTDCTTTNGADLITSYVRDSALRVTQLTRPDGSCVFNAYDTTGRLSSVKRRDDCSSSSSGDYQLFGYTADNQLYEIKTYNAGGTAVATKDYSFYPSRRMKEIQNPVDSTYKTLDYQSNGILNEVDDESSLGKTTYTLNSDNRITAETRYKTSSTYDSWTLAFDWIGDQSSVTDGDSKVTQSVRDDLGRLVELESPDRYAKYNVYDAAGRLVTVVETQPSANLTHSFTFDYAGRPLNDDYSGTCSTGTPHAEIIRAYDAMPSGVTCPITGGCTNIARPAILRQGQSSCARRHTALRMARSISRRSTPTMPMAVSSRNTSPTTPGASPITSTAGRRTAR